MRRKSLLLVFFATLFFSQLTAASDVMTDSSTNKSFPMTDTFDYKGKSYHLSGTGVATRKFLWFKIYSIASYIEDPASLKGKNLFMDILDSKKAKQLSFIWLRNIGKKKVQDGYLESFEKAAPKNSLSKEVDTWIHFFGNVKAGDKHTIYWVPDGTVILLINGEQKGRIDQEEFAKDLWSIWFGKNSVVDRNRLVSELR